MDNNGYELIEIEVDGNISFENAKLMSAAGANIFVAETSSLFKKDIDVKTAICQFRKLLV